jgi:hypothetical protein
MKTKRLSLRKERQITAKVARKSFLMINLAYLPCREGTAALTPPEATRQKFAALVSSFACHFRLPDWSQGAYPAAMGTFVTGPFDVVYARPQRTRGCVERDACLTLSTSRARAVLFALNSGG